MTACARPFLSHPWSSLPGRTAIRAAARRPAAYADAVEAYLRSAGIGTSSRRVYRISLPSWAWLAAGQQPPLGRDRRGAAPPVAAFAALDDPTAAEVLAEAFARRARLVDADTVNRELSVLKAAITWWRQRG